MPLNLTPEDKRYLLSKKGYDPDKYQLDDSGFIIPAPATETSDVVTADQPKLNVTQPQSSITEATARAAAGSVIPTVGAWGGSALATGALTALEIVQPEIGIPAAIIAALAGGYGAGKLQEAVVPDEVKKNLFSRPEDIAQHPVASFVGGQLPNVAFANPVKGVSELADVAKNIPNALKNPGFMGKAFTDANKATALNALIGSGVGAGVNTAQQLANGGEFSIPEVLGSAAAGTIFNSPWDNPVNRGLGLAHPQPTATERLGYVPPSVDLPYEVKPGQPTTVDPTASLTATETKAITPAVIESTLAEPPAVAKRTANDIMSLRERELTGQPLPLTEDEIARAKALPNDASPPEGVGLIRGINAEELASIAARNSAQAKAQKQAEIDAAQSQRNMELVAKDRANQIEKYVNKSPYASDPQARAVFEHVLNSHPDPLRDPVTLGTAEMQARSVLESKKQTEAAVAKNEADLEMVKAQIEAGREALKNQEAANDLAQQAEKSKAVTEANTAPELKIAQPGLNSEEVVRYSRKPKMTEEEGIAKLKELGLEFRDGKWVAINDKGQRINATPEEATAIRHEGMPSRSLTREELALAQRRGVNLQEDPNIPLDSNGNETLGAEYYQGRQARTNPYAATEATAGHEVVGHTYLTDLFNSADPRDVRLAQRTHDLAKSISPTDFVEVTADNVGAEVARRLELKLRGSAREKFNNWIEDFKAYRAHKQGSETPEQAVRLVSNRALHDAPFGTRKELVNDVTISKTLRQAQAGVRGSDSTGSDSIDKSAEDNRNQAGRDATDESAKGGSNDNASVELVDKNTQPSSAETKAAEPSTNKEGTTKTPMEGESSASESPALRYSTKRQDQPAPRDVRISVPLMRSEIDAIANNKKLGPNREKVAGALSHLEEATSRLHGKLRETPLADFREIISTGNVKDMILGNNSSATKIAEYMDARMEGKPLPTLTPNEQAGVNYVDQFLKRLRTEQNSREGLRQGSFTKNYVPQTFSNHAIDTLLNKPGTPEAQKMRVDYINHVGDRIFSAGDAPTLQAGEKKAAEFFDNMVKYFNKSKAGAVDIASSYGPIDKAAGYGLPESMRDNNMFARLQKTGDRYARRFAYYDAIESQPDIVDALFGSDGIARANDVKGPLSRLTGIRPQIGVGIEAGSSLFNSFIIGTFGGVRDFVSTGLLGAQHLTPLQVPKAILKGLWDIPSVWKESFSQGLNRQHIGMIEGNDGMSGLSGASNFARHMRDISNSVQLRNVLEQAGRAWAYGQGKMVTLENINAATRGSLSKQQRFFLDKFAPADWEARFKPNFKPSDELIADIASRYTESVVGTYGSRGLPGIVHDSHLAPFLQLSRWSVEKANDFVKNVVDPATKGNFTPLLNQTLVSLVGGGAALEALNELINKRKSRLPSTGEIAAAKEQNGEWKLAMAYKVAGLAALSGYGGELMNLSKMVLDGHYGGRANWYNWPVAGLAHDAVTYLPQLEQAIANKDVELATTILSDMTENQFQTYRVLLRQASKGKQDELLKADQNRDLRVFRKLMGYDTGETPTFDNKDYSNWHAQQFKKAQTFEEIQSTLPKAIQEAFNKQQPEDVMKAVKGLKHGQAQIAPSLTENPLQSAQFARFMDVANGKGAGIQRIAENERLKSMNKYKSSLVP